MTILDELTLRDLFAVFALQALTSHLESSSVAQVAYDIADQMLACRDKPDE